MMYLIQGKNSGVYTIR